METEIFTCKYFKFGRNTTGLTQSHLRNFLACSISISNSPYSYHLRTFARNFSNIDFFLKILPLKDHVLAMEEM